MFPPVRAFWVLGVLSGLVQGRQVPLRFEAETAHWDLNSSPGENSTDHLVFDTVNSFLQHWPNTRYRNGHNIVPGTIPVGNLFYHGGPSSDIPTVPEWLATDPEHSYLFCRGSREAGCWHHTYVTTRPLKILYFDGSAAAKMEGGTMDSQDIVLWGEVKPEWTFQERKRVDELCTWGKQYGIDAFVRMEPDFEIMQCDFKDGLQPVSRLNLAAPIENSPRGPPPPGGPPPRYPLPSPSSGYRSAVLADNTGRETVVLEAGSWHNYYPGDPRFELDYSRIISFYDTDLVPSLIPSRLNQTRFTHRLINISSSDVRAVMQRLDDVLRDPAPSSGIDWRGLFRVISLRYADRLELLQHHLNASETQAIPRTPLEVASLVQQEVRIMLAPYILHSAVPPPSGRPNSNAWASPVYRHCATTHMEFITSISSTLTPSERLLLKAIRGTNREICRTIVKIWAEAVREGLDPALPSPAPVVRASEERLSEVLEGWRANINSLMKWLSWSIWIKCRPACSFEEMCYLPTWPFFRRPVGEDPHRHRGLPGPTYEDEIFPEPRCIRRVAPYSVDF